MMTEVQLITTPTLCPLFSLSHPNLKEPAEQGGEGLGEGEGESERPDPLPRGVTLNGGAVEGLNFAGLDTLMPENETVLQAGMT